MIGYHLDDVHQLMTNEQWVEIAISTHSKTGSLGFQFHFFFLITLRFLFLFLAGSGKHSGIVIIVFRTFSCLPLGFTVKLSLKLR